jgi:hypothetical protein
MTTPATYRRRSLVLATTGWLVACGAPQPTNTPHVNALNPKPAAEKQEKTKPSLNEVIVLGMIHGEHRDHPTYGIEVIKDIVRAIRPRYVLTEIPPDRFDKAAAQFRDTGRIIEPRVSRFPEYVDALFPLQAEKSSNFEIVPCAAWTQAMQGDRKAKLTRWKAERPDDYAEMNRAQAEAERLQKLEDLDGDPWAMHTERYDALVEQGMEPYNRLFNDDLGAGGWNNINAAHYALIAKALDAHRGEGARFLVTFGAWHKYWLKRELRRRDDVVLRTLSDFFPRPS